MNDSEVESQIEHMCKFIEQEAQEKAGEIEATANEEFNLEKLQLYETEKSNIRKEYERKEGQAEVQKKIAYSKYVNETRLKILAAREEAVKEVLKTARQQLQSLAKNKTKYKTLLQKLLVQALRKLGEATAVVKCREVDKSLVESVIEPAREEYASTYGEAAPVVQLDEEEYLKPPPTAKVDDPAYSCCGGLVVTSADHRIVLSNTLDDRLMISFQENLPAVREKLFV